MTVLNLYAEIVTYGIRGAGYCYSFDTEFSARLEYIERTANIDVEHLLLRCVIGHMIGCEVEDFIAVRHRGLQFLIVCYVPGAKLSHSRYFGRISRKTDHFHPGFIQSFCCY